MATASRIVKNRQLPSKSTLMEQSEARIAVAVVADDHDDDRLKIVLTECLAKTYTGDMRNDIFWWWE